VKWHRWSPQSVRAKQQTNYIIQELASFNNTTSEEWKIARCNKCFAQLLAGWLVTRAQLCLTSFQATAQLTPPSSCPDDQKKALLKFLCLSLFAIHIQPILHLQLPRIRHILDKWYILTYMFIVWLTSLSFSTTDSLSCLVETVNMSVFSSNCDVSRQQLSSQKRNKMQHMNN
jgi:hypothetical protein